MTSYLNSLKSQTRKERGTGIRRKFVGSGMTPKSWNNFLLLNENKTKLFSFLAELNASLDPSKLVCVTQGENVLCNNNIDRSGLCPCNREEEDTRIFIHVKHAAVHGLKTSLAISTDTAVVGLAISMFEKREIDKLWIVFGKGKYLKWIPIREILNALGKRALDLPFSHAVICCNTVSTCRGKGKRTAWQAWKIFDDATDTFIRLSETPAAIGDQYHDIPPTRAALLEHTKRAAYQGGHVWGQSLNCVQDIPNPDDRGGGADLNKGILLDTKLEAC